MVDDHDTTKIKDSCLSIKFIKKESNGKPDELKRDVTLNLDDN